LLYGYRKLYEGKLDEEKIQKEVNEVFTAADSDGSGAIDFSEWAVASSKKENVISDEKLQVAFRLFDQDGSGSISSEEIKRVLGVGKKFGDEKIWDQILKEVDRNGDGVITFDEFKYMMQKFLSHDL
jgi:calcium-dependent protein kinase